MSVTNWLLGPNDKRSPWFRTHPAPGSVNGIDLSIDSTANLFLPGVNQWAPYLFGPKPQSSLTKKQLPANFADRMRGNTAIQQGGGRTGEAYVGTGLPNGAVTPPAPETVVESPGGGAGGGSGAAGAPGRSSGSGGVGPSNTETRTNANQVTQTGRNLSKINLTPSAGVADFTGPSFPTQAASNQISAPYPNTTPGGLEKTKENFFGPYERVLTQGYKQNPGHLEGEPAEVPGTSVQLPRTPTSSYETFDANDPRFADAFGEDLAKSLGGTSRYGDSGAERPQNPARRRRSGDIRDRDIDARGGFDPRFDNRGESDSYEAFKPADYATSSQEMARRAAFLSTPGGAREGMVAVKKGLGLVEEGRDNYALAGGEFHKISPEHKRELLNTPQNEVDSWRADWYQTNVVGKKGKSADTPTTGKANYNQPVPVPAQAQNPTVIPPEKPESFNVPGRKFGPGGLFQ